MLIRSLLLCLFLYSSTISQTLIEQNVGSWTGVLSKNNPFSFTIFLQQENSGLLTVHVKGQKTDITLTLRPLGQQNIYGADINAYLYVKVRLGNNSKNPDMFLQNGQVLSHINLVQMGQNSWQGSWDLFLVKDFDPTFYLSLEKVSDTEYAAYGFYRASQNQTMYCQNFSFKENKIQFEDKNSGMTFTGTLSDRDNIHLVFKFLDDSMDVALTRLEYEEWQIGKGAAEARALSYSGKNIESQKDIVSAKAESQGLDRAVLEQLKKDIISGQWPDTHSVLIARNNRLVFEEYFQGFDYDTPHDTRSASKSLASAAVGIAIDQKYIKSVNEPVAPFFPEYSKDISWAANKIPITIYHLLTMSTGLDIIDGGDMGNSFASEWVYQNEKDWTGHILKAPLVYETGSASYYGSGNAQLLGEILKRSVKQPLEYYLYDNLIKPLGWSGYKIQTDDKGMPYFGGGWYLTSRDMLKFALCFLNKGYFNGSQIISAGWVEQSLAKHNILKNRNDIEYGYLWWQRDYQKADKKIASVEARGNGGQYIFIVPEYKMVVVITSGNYRNRELLKQPEWLMEKYIIKSIKD